MASVRQAKFESTVGAQKLVFKRTPQTLIYVHDRIRQLLPSHQLLFTHLSVRSFSGINMLEYDAASPTPVKEGDQRHHNVRDFVNEPQTPQMFIEAVVEKPYGSDTYKLSNYATSITPEATATVTPASVGVDLPSTSTPYATPHAARQDHHSRYAMIQEHSTPLSAPQQFRYTQGGSTTPLQYSTPQTMHHSQSSNEIVLRQQLLQMQEQMALMSRAISQANQV